MRAEDLSPLAAHFESCLPARGPVVIINVGTGFSAVAMEDIAARRGVCIWLESPDASQPVAADIVYVDYPAVVRAALEAYWKLLKPGGCMFGDGYGGVTDAVDEFAAAKSLIVNVYGAVWSVRKPV